MNDYCNKTNAELQFIIKVAAEVAEALRGWNDLAECKYLDQVNDARTELYRRRNKSDHASTD